VDFVTVTKAGPEVAGSRWTGSHLGSHQIEHIGGMTGQGQTKVSHGCSKLGNATLETMPKNLQTQHWRGLPRFSMGDNATRQSFFA
jgi:hypothetical protein